MFATFRSRHDSLSVERAGSTPNFSACNFCRSKKLRCSGELPECRRCRLQQAECEYTAPTVRRRANSSKSSESVPNNIINALPSPPASTQSTNPQEGPVSPNSTISRPRQHGSDTPMELDLRGIIPDFGQIGPATTPADIDVSSSSFLEGFHVNAALEDNEGTLIGMNDMDYLFSFHDRLPDQLNHSEQPFFMDVSYNLTPLPSPMPPKPCFFYPQLHSRAQPEQLTALESMNLLKPSASASNLNGVLLSCSCVSTALTLLEELAVDGHDTGTQSTSQRLGFKRRCLLTCATLLGCSECSKIPRFLMLLIQICQKAVDSYVVLAKILQEGKSLHGHLTGLSYPESFQQVPVSKTAPYPMYNAQDVSPTHGAGPSMSLGEYDVTSEEEMCVFTSLATMQLAKWKGFLGQLSERCASLGLKSHMAMGVQLERRVQMQMHELSLSG